MTDKRLLQRCILMISFSEVFRDADVDSIGYIEEVVVVLCLKGIYAPWLCCLCGVRAFCVQSSTATRFH